MKLVQKAKYLLIGIAAMMAAAVFTPGVKNVNAATQGIDVSQWQGTINWGAVKNSGISYAMVRAGVREVQQFREAKRATIIPIYKKGTPLDPGNYRGIAIGNVTQ